MKLAVSMCVLNFYLRITCGVNIQPFSEFMTCAPTPPTSTIKLASNNNPSGHHLGYIDPTNGPLGIVFLLCFHVISLLILHATTSYTFSACIHLFDLMTRNATLLFTCHMTFNNYMYIYSFSICYKHITFHILLFF